MQYRSTRNKGIAVSSAEAIKKGLSNEGGLFVPDRIPALEKSLTELSKMSYQEVAYEVMKLLLTDFTEEELNADPETVPNLTFFHQMLFPVTSEMINTIEFLKKYDLFKYLEIYETNFEAYLFDINASEYWKSLYVSFGMDVSYEPVTFDEVSLSSIIYNTSLIIDKNAPLNHSTLFTTEYSIHVANYGEVSESNDNSAKNNLQELIDSGYATKLSETTAQEYFEMAKEIEKYADR